MNKQKPIYRRPILCLIIYLFCVLCLMVYPLPILFRLSIIFILSVLIIQIWNRNYQHLNVHREELRMVANTIEDAMWSIKPNGTIEWMNPAFLSIFNASEDQRYKNYTEVIKVPVVRQFIRDFMQNQEERMSEVTFDDQYYLITGSINPNAERIVFIMQNINLIRQTEKMKKDFMVNVAHELRTPLTAIKGFTLALEEDFTIDNKRYLKIIKNHTDRLINMISDLQTLAKLERMPELDIQEIDLRIFMENIMDMYVPSIQKAGLYLKYTQYPEDILVSVDPFKFEQIFVNLIDNALHYTDNGGFSISAIKTDSDLTIEVADTGSGISIEHISRIFERFYVADPSRNKKISGTGLGLAIVKHAVLLHHGSINVLSEPNKGTRFTMIFPNQFI